MFPDTILRYTVPQTIGPTWFILLLQRNLTRREGLTLLHSRLRAPVDPCR